MFSPVHIVLAEYLWFNPLMDFSLLPFFKPQCVVIDASAYGVTGKTWLQRGANLSQKQRTLFTHPLYAGLTPVSDPVDFAILIVPTFFNLLER
jgi:hypothetical protein